MAVAGPGLREARVILDAALQRPGPRLTTADARVFHADGVLRLRDGNLPAARISLLQALAGMRAAGETWRAATVLDTLGNLHMRLGDASRARRHFDESLAAAEFVEAALSE